MKKTFFQYNMGKNGTISNIIENGLIVLDANALLNVYRFNKDNREKYIEILDAVKDRLFLTYQSVQEFYNNRLTIIYNKSNFKEDLKQELNKKITDINTILKDNNFQSGKKDSCNLIKHEQGLKDSIVEILDKANKEIDEKINSYNIDINKNFIKDDDPILDKILEIFEGKINKSFTDEKLEEIYKLGKERYEAKIPPGYEDSKNKAEPDRYGDLIIWNEIISIVKGNQKDVLFVSDDRKDDWCEKFKGFDLGPRKELIKEFFDETNKNFHSVTTKDFIKYISDLHTIKDTTELEKESDIIRKELISSNSESEDEQCINQSYHRKKYIDDKYFINQMNELDKRENCNMDKENISCMLDEVMMSHRVSRKTVPFILNELLKYEHSDIDEDSNIDVEAALLELDKTHKAYKRNEKIMLSILDYMDENGESEANKAIVIDLLREMKSVDLKNKRASLLLIDKIIKRKANNVDKETASEMVDVQYKLSRDKLDDCNKFSNKLNRRQMRFLNKNSSFDD